MDKLNELFTETIKKNETTGGEKMEKQTLSFTSNLDKLHPEIAQKVLEHGAPELGKTVREVSTSAKDVSIRGFQSVDQSAGRMYNLFDKSTDVAINCINDKNTSDEVKIKAFDTLNETNKTAAAEHNKVMEYAAGESSKQWTGGLIATSILAAFLGAGFTALTGIPFKFK